MVGVEGGREGCRRLKKGGSQRKEKTEMDNQVGGVRVEGRRRGGEGGNR